jgi:hypothetical protein
MFFFKTLSTMRISNREITHDSRLDSKFALSIKFKKKQRVKNYGKQFINW